MRFVPFSAQTPLRSGRAEKGCLPTNVICIQSLSLRPETYAVPGAQALSCHWYPPLLRLHHCLHLPDSRLGRHHQGGSLLRIRWHLHKDLESLGRVHNTPFLSLGALLLANSSWQQSSLLIKC